MKSDENFPQSRNPLDLAQQLFANAEVRSVARTLPLADRDYLNLFWRPYVGAIPFSFYELLCSLDWYVEHKGRWPSISLMTQMLGKGVDRHTILGRAATKKRPALEGALDILVRDHLVAFDTIGEGRGTRYNFVPKRNLPLLTPSQVRRAGPSPLRKAHLLWLQTHHVDIENWKKIKAPSLIPLL